MPRVPLPTVPSVQPASYQGAAPASKAAKYQGQADLAEGIGAAGSVMQRAALQAQAVKNEADLSRARLAMEQAEANIQSDMEKTPDPEQWEALSQARIEEAQGAIFASEGGKGLAPVVRQQLENDFRAFNQRTVTNTRMRAQIRRNDEADKLLVQEQDKAIASANLEAATAVIDKRESLGLISPARATAERETVALAVDVQAVNRDIAQDPFTALEKIQDRTDGGKPRFYRNLSEKDRLSAERSAKNAMETARAETSQMLGERILQNGGVGMEQAIDNWLKAGRILPSQAVNLKKFAAGQRKPQEMAAVGAQLWQASIDLDRSDPDYIQKAMRIRADAYALDPTVRAPIIETLDGKDRNDVKEDVQRVYDALNRDFRANTFGNIQTYTQAEIDGMSSRERKKAGNPVEGDPKDKTGFEAASSRLFRYQRAMREFLQANPKATVDQIQEYKARLTATDRQAALGGIAIDALSGAR